MSNNIQEAISINDVLSNDKYIIPIYQRNYEWEKEQISRLILDINSITENENYYLGTLVTFKRNDSKFELIDGQQRHTTLNLIKAFLSDTGQTFNLEFQARSECDRFFKELSNGNTFENDKSKNLKNGLKIIEDVFNESNIDKVSFKNIFEKQTFVFRTELPENTDLNHYFEIMNNRGEQLEKHEILKVQLMSVFGEDKTKSQTFVKIWDACAYMGDYVWDNFSKEESLKIFTNGKYAELCNDSFTFLKLNDIFIQIEAEKNIQYNSNIQNITSLSFIIDNYKLPEKFNQDEQEKTDKYRSILDFSSFLIYVFNLIHTEKSTTYDDKKLLEIFKNYEDSENFIMELLKTRIYFDQFIIKNDLTIQSQNESKWGIRSFKIENSKDIEKFEIKTTETTFENSKNDEDKIEMLQAMFYYSNISNDKKDWLIEVLKEKPILENELYEVLFKHFQSEIKGIELNNLIYPEVSAKTFYYFEYMLWEFYIDFAKGENNKLEVKSELISLKDKIVKNKGLFNDFRFRQLNSKEHILSQNKFHVFKEELKLEEHNLHSFANLCLISTSENSSSSNLNHFEKKSKNNNSNSLKRIMVFESFDDKNWNIENMNNHLKEMKLLLELYQNN